MCKFEVINIIDDLIKEVNGTFWHLEYLILIYNNI